MKKIKVKKNDIRLNFLQGKKIKGIGKISAKETAKKNISGTTKSCTNLCIENVELKINNNTVYVLDHLWLQERKIPKSLVRRSQIGDCISFACETYKYRVKSDYDRFSVKILDYVIE